MRLVLPQRRPTPLARTREVPVHLTRGEPPGHHPVVLADLHDRLDQLVQPGICHGAAHYTIYSQIPKATTRILEAALQLGEPDLTCWATLTPPKASRRNPRRHQ